MIKPLRFPLAFAVELIEPIVIVGKTSPSNAFAHPSKKLPAEEAADKVGVKVALKSAEIEL